jgi:hypothetical protein
MEFTSYTPGQLIEGTEPLPDGRHECVIVSAVDKFDNGDAFQRVVFQPVKGPDVYAWPTKKIFDRAGKDGADFAAIMADALQIDRSNGLDLKPALMIGRNVLVSTRQWTTNDGKVIANVDTVRGTWTERGGAIPAAPQSRPAPPGAFELGPITGATSPAAAPKPRTPAAAVAAARGDEAGGSDDVPF